MGLFLSVFEGQQKMNNTLFFIWLYCLKPTQTKRAEYCRATPEPRTGSENGYTHLKRQEYPDPRRSIHLYIIYFFKKYIELLPTLKCPPAPSKTGLKEKMQHARLLVAKEHAHLESIHGGKKGEGINHPVETGTGKKHLSVLLQN